jgi:hypothetical protein
MAFGDSSEHKNNNNNKPILPTPVEMPIAISNGRIADSTVS